MGEAQTVGFYPAVNVRNVSPKIDEVSENKEIAAVGDSIQRGAVSTNQQGGVHQSGDSASSRVEDKRQEQEAEIEEEKEEARNMKAETTPRTPTAEEYRVHRLTHLPCRSWCPHCVESKKKNPAHTKRRREGHGREREIPVISIDYMYMTSCDADSSNLIVVINDSENGGVWAFMVLKKGSANTYIAERIAKTINFMGYPKCAIRCDQEPSMRQLQKEVRTKIWREKIEAAKSVVEILGKERVEIIEPETMEITLESSPVGESQSNRFIERAIQGVQGQIRTIKDTIESEAKM